MQYDRIAVPLTVAQQLTVDVLRLSASSTPGTVYVERNEHMAWIYPFWLSRSFASVTMLF